jgi:hypothetical protein
MLTFTTPDLRKRVKDEDPTDTVAHAVDSIDFFEFSDLDESVKSDVQFLRENPLILKETVITGWVYHVETGKVAVSAFTVSVSSVDGCIPDSTSKLKRQIISKCYRNAHARCLVRLERPL